MAAQAVSLVLRVVDLGRCLCRCWCCRRFYLQGSPRRTLCTNFARMKQARKNCGRSTSAAQHRLSQMSLDILWRDLSDCFVCSSHVPLWNTSLPCLVIPFPFEAMQIREHLSLREMRTRGCLIRTCSRCHAPIPYFSCQKNIYPRLNISHASYSFYCFSSKDRMFGYISTTNYGKRLGYGHMRPVESHIV